MIYPTIAFVTWFVLAILVFLITGYVHWLAMICLFLGASSIASLPVLVLWFAVESRMPDDQGPRS